MRVLLLVALIVGLAGTARGEYEDGLEAARRGDYATAVQVWQGLAEQGDARAQSDLGFLYGNGRGVERNDAKAVRWYREAAVQGYPVAQFNLGYMFLNGLGTPRDAGEGLSWYGRAAEQGFAAAQFNLGVRYYHGRDVEQRHDEAYFWLALAAKQGHDRAAHARDQLAHQLTSQQLSAADRRVADWQPRISTVPSAAPPRPQEPVASAPAPLQAEAKSDVATAPQTTELVPVVQWDPAAEESATASEGGAVSETRAAPTEPPPDVERARVEPEPEVSRTAIPDDKGSQVQLGALPSAEAALNEWDSLMLAHADLIGELEHEVRRVDLGPEKGVLYRLRAGAFAQLADAKALCAELARRSVACFAIAPSP